jgi:endonuclease G, mitochondrial
MKKIILFFIAFGSYAQVQHVKNDVYECWFSEAYRQPVELRYTVLCNQNSTAKFSRSGLDFKNDSPFKTSTDYDYKANIYDKGHCAPAADFNCDKEKLAKTFSYINCALQNQYLNRGAWKELEDYERELSLKGKVSVVIKVVFESNKKINFTTIPTGFYKMIYLDGKLFETYYFANEKPEKDFKQYKK